MNGPEVVLVDKDSATAGRHWENEPHHILSVNANHSDIVKFGDNDEDYVRVRSQLRGILSESEGTIRNRFPRALVRSMRNVAWHAGSDLADSTISVNDALSPALSEDAQGQSLSLNLVVDHFDNKSVSRDKTYPPGPRLSSTPRHRTCFPRSLWLWSIHLSINARITIAISIIIAICIITAITLGIVIPAASPKPRYI